MKNGTNIQMNSLPPYFTLGCYSSWNAHNWKGKNWLCE